MRLALKSISQKSTRGGRRQGAGRKRGSRNRATSEQVKSIGDLARQFAPEAVATLVDVMKNGISEAARVSAATNLLDRAYGRPTQHFDVDQASSNAAVEDPATSKAADYQLAREIAFALAKGQLAHRRAVLMVEHTRSRTNGGVLDEVPGARAEVAAGERRRELGATSRRS